MFNEITIGPLTLHMYGLMIGLGFLAAYAMCYYRGKKMKMEKKRRYPLWNLLVCHHRRTGGNQIALLYCRDSGDYQRPIHSLGL